MNSHQLAKLFGTN